MSYTEERFFTRGTHFGKQWRISILKNGGAGASERITASDYFFKRRYPFTSDRDFWNQKIIEPILEVKIIFNRDTDISFYRDIVANPDDTYRLQFQYDGVIDCFGSIRADMVQISEDPANPKVTLRAKPLAILRGTLYPLDAVDSFTEIAPLIGEMCNLTETNLDLYTYGEWTSPNGGTNDYFEDAAYNTYHLRDYAGTRDQDTQITYYEALEKAIPPGHILTLKDNAWHLVSVPYIAKNEGTSINRYKYTFGGTVYAKDSSATVDMRVSLGSDRGDSAIKTTKSDSKYFSGFKRIRDNFRHQTLITNFDLESPYVFTGVGQSPEAIDNTITADGSQHVIVKGTVEVDTNDTGGNAKTGVARLLLQAGDREYDIVGDQWELAGDEIEISLSGTGETLTADINIETDAVIPSSVGEATVRLELRYADDQGSAFAWTADEVTWTITDYQLVNEDIAATGASKEFIREQTQQYEEVLSIPDRIFGEGPTPYSKSAISYLSTNYIPISTFDRKSGASVDSYADLVSVDIMNAQRDGVRVLKAALWSDFGVLDVVPYDGGYFMILGGDFEGYASFWDATMYELTYSTGSDILIEVQDAGGSPTGGRLSGSNETDGITESQADAKYFKQASLLSEVDAGDLPTLYGNIGLDDASADLELNSLDINGSAFVDSSRNVSANKAIIGNDLSPFESGTAGKLYLTNDWDGSGDGQFQIVASSSNKRFRIGYDTTNDRGIIQSTEVAVGNKPTVFNPFGGNVGVGKDPTSLFDVGGAVNIDSTLTINSQLLFTQGNEQLLSTDAGVDFVDLTLTDFLTVGGISTFNGAIDANSTSNFEGVMTLQDNITADAFSAGFQGAEWQITNAGQAEFEDVFIRGGLTAYEAIINRVRYNFGNTVLSAGGGKVASVSGSAGSETVVFEDPEGNTILPVAEGDLLLLQNWDLNRTTIIKRIWRKVASISGTDVTLTKDGDMPSDTGSIVAGDELVVNGNDGTTANRDAIIFQSVTETTHPFIKIQDNINSFTDWGSDSTTQVLIGDLTDAPDLSNGTTPSGIGFFAKGSAYLEGEIVASSGLIGGLGIFSDYINIDNVYIGNELSRFSRIGTLYVGNFNDGSLPLIRAGGDVSGSYAQMVGQTSSSSNFIEAAIGGNIIFSVSGDGALLAGGNFDQNRLWNYDSNGGLELNWTSQFLKMYEDAGTTARVTIDGDSTSLPTSATIRDSISGSSGAITSELTTVNYEPISGSWAPEETSGDNLTTYDFRVTYQGWDGSTWNTIETYDGSLAGSSVGISRPFTFQDLSGYTKFRIRIDDRNSSGGTWAFDSYSANQIKTETIITKRGAAFVGGALYFVDLPKNTDADFNVDSLPINSVYSDEKDGNGNWILKMKA